MSKLNCAAVFSGGLDSTTLVYDLLEAGHVPHLISFDYGQRHSRELQYAKATADKLGLRHDIIDLTGITHLISNSALTSAPDERLDQDDYEKEFIDVPEGHYAEDNMKKTVVPNRNMIMLSIATGVAVSNHYDAVATGVHAGDHFVYPDCRPTFISYVNKAIVSGNLGFGKIPETGIDNTKNPYDFVYAPFLNRSKAEIAYLALQLDVPLHETWSCYKGDEVHCGKCGTCVERLEAIAQATSRYDRTYGLAVPDRTEYADTEFWKEAVSA